MKRPSGKFSQAVLESGVSSRWREREMSSARDNSGFNERCSFTAGLMEPSGDPSRSLSLSPRGKRSLQQRNGHLWD